MTIISHMHPKYADRRLTTGSGRRNGAYFYSKELVENIIPNIKTDRNWVTVNEYDPYVDLTHSIVFVHNNLHPEHYAWTTKFKDIILVCGIEDTVEKVEKYHKAIYLPLSVDTKYLERFRCPKTREQAFVGRKSKLLGNFRTTLPENCDIIANMEREELLAEMAKYRKVYAVGRCAIEAKYLGAEIGAYDERFPDPSIWKVLDNSEAVEILQKKLDEIDRNC